MADRRILLTPEDIKELEEGKEVEKFDLLLVPQKVIGCSVNVKIPEPGVSN